MKDFLGREFEVGDLIVYPKMSGRSVCLVKGVVKKFNDSGTVTVQPEVESWNGGQDRSTTEKYIDTRTGKSFNAYHDNADQHVERGYGGTNKETGEWISSEEYSILIQRVRHDWLLANPDSRYVPHSVEWEFSDKFTHTSRVWKDYVKIESTIPTVTIKRTDNIILVDKRV